MPSMNLPVTKLRINLTTLAQPPPAVHRHGRDGGAFAKGAKPPLRSPEGHRRTVIILYIIGDLIHTLRCLKSP